MATLVVKAHLPKADGSVETRRFSISQELATTAGLFETVSEKIGKVFTDLENKIYSLRWKDTDEDYVLMSTDEEMQDAISTLGNSVLHIYIQVDGDKQVKMTKINEASQSESGTKPQNDEDQEMDQNDWYGYPPFGFQPGMMGPPPPPPPPPFPFHHGPFNWPHGESFRPHHKFHMGRGMRHNPFGMHHPFGRRGHPFGFHHPGLHRHGHHHHHHGDRDDTATYGKFFKKGADWKTELRNAVPLLHRRWAKMFIQKWRQENLANATTTSSETDNGTEDELTMEKAGVPVSYKKWLNLKLPLWHKKWGAYKVSGKKNDDSDIDEVSKEEKKLIKASVPKEFRKWTKWYLQRRFGQRVAPRFKVEVNTCTRKGYECLGDNGPVEEVPCKKKGQGRYKKQILASLVPASHRIWAKKFIHEWRFQNKLENQATASATTSESDEADLGEEEVTVPQDYGKWLEVFLPRWHRWRGMIEKKDGQEDKGGMGRFKDSVPMNFRAWVKHYLCRQYGKQKSLSQEDSVEDPSAKYRAWLQMFQKKWLRDQQSVGEDSDDFTVLTSGDEGETVKSRQVDENGEIPDKSFKRLRLSDEEETTPQKSVHFDPNTQQHSMEENKMQKRMMKLMKSAASAASDSDDEVENRKSRRKMPINHGFRKWVWQELDSWDGQNLADDSTEIQRAEEVDDIPPHVYQWMSKVMMKLQVKKLKQQMKISKREMKASQKLAKAEMKAARRAANYVH